MLWTIIKQALRNRRIMWIVYGVIALLFMLLYLATFPAVQQQQQFYDQIVNTLPKAVVEAFNITKTPPTLMGYLSSKHFGFTWDLMIIFLIIAYAGGAIAKEIDNRTMGILLSLPVSRLKLYWGRVAAGAIGLVLFILFSEVVTWPLALLFKFEISWGEVWSIGVLGFVFGLAVLGIGMLFSAMFSESGKVYGAVGGLFLVMYVLNIVSGLEDKLANVKYASLFHYFVPGNLTGSGAMDWTALLVLAVVGIFTAVLGSVIFNRRDISV